MGAWGIGNFENDAAMDWINEFNENPALEDLASVFQSVTTNEDFIEYDDAAIVLAAAEIVAAIKGKQSDSYPEDIPAFTEIKIENGFVDRVLTAVEIVANSDKSELKQLWKETGEFAQWNAVIDDLKKNLQ